MSQPEVRVRKHKRVEREPNEAESENLRRRYVRDRYGDYVYVGRWPSDKGFERLRKHYKRQHPRAFRASIRKGVATRKRHEREEKK